MTFLDVCAGPVRYLSVCSGIEAATVAWGPLGWEAMAFSEIEKFAAAVLAHHYPDVPNLGDMTKIDGAEFRGKIDVLVGGTPCQSFSVAGLRRGLEDERGNLALEFVRIADELNPSFVVWENVPGVLSDRGNAFGCFLAALAGECEELLPPGGRWTNSGYVLGPERTIAWRILDAQYFGLAQRRRRVFVIASPRGGADPRKILFEFDGMRRDTPPCREARTSLAGTIDGSLGRSRGAGTNPGVITEIAGTLGNISGSRGWSVNAEQAASGHLQVQCYGGNNTSGSINVAPRLGCNESGSGYRLDFESDTLVAHTLRGEGFDASEDGTGRANLIAAIHPHCIGRAPDAGPQGKEFINDGSAYTMDTRGVQCVAFAQNTRDEVRLQAGDGSIVGALGANDGMKQQTYVAAVSLRGREGGGTAELSGDVATALRSSQGGGDKPHCLQHSAVRRLMPVECERLQGFPDGYTAVPYKRPFGDLPRSILERSYTRYLRRCARQRKAALPLGELIMCADGPRYKALGNSMAVPVMRWIGERIGRCIMAAEGER